MSGDCGANARYSYVRLGAPDTRAEIEVVEAIGIVAIPLGLAVQGIRVIGATLALRKRIGLGNRFVKSEELLAQVVATVQRTLVE